MMLEKEFKKLNKAYEEYNLDKRENISIKVLNYIKNRLIENKVELQELSEMLDDISYMEIEKIFLEEAFNIEEYKKEKLLKRPRHRSCPPSRGPGRCPPRPPDGRSPGQNQNAAG